MVGRDALIYFEASVLPMGGTFKNLFVNIIDLSCVTC